MCVCVNSACLAQRIFCLFTYFELKFYIFFLFLGEQLQEKTKFKTTKTKSFFDAENVLLLFNWIAPGFSCRKCGAFSICYLQLSSLY